MFSAYIWHGKEINDFRKFCIEHKCKMVKFKLKNGSIHELPEIFYDMTPNIPSEELERYEVFAPKTT